MKFLNTFILLIDTVLEDVYDNPISREDYLTFLDWFERRLSIYRNEFNNVPINNNKERTNWGRVKIDGKYEWRLQIILNTLLDKNILQSTGYDVKKHPRRYSYTLSFLNGLKITKESLVIDQPINDKLYQSFQSHTKKYDKDNSQYQLLISDRFSIDTDKCVSYLLNSFLNKEITKTEFLVNIKRLFDIDKKNIFLVQIENGRVYTSFNNLKKELRQFCYIDNEPLFSLDLKSSQPLIFISYLKEKYPDVSDINKFYDIVTQEDVYDWFGFETRDKAKLEMFRYLFKKSNKGNVDLDSLMSEKFPGLHQLVKQERNLFSEMNTTLADHLQSIEADIFIPVQNEFCSEGCLSVHDSLYFKKELHSGIKKELEDRLKSKHIFKYNLL